MKPPPMPPPSKAHPRPKLSRFRTAGFTLLEVILALAVLAGSVAMLGELINFAHRNAKDAQAETRAQLLANSLMDEMVTGITDLDELSREPLDVDDTVRWVYSVSFEAAELDSLTSVEITVEQDLEKKFHPVRYRLVRWLPTDPGSTGGNETEENETNENETTESEEADDG